MAKSTPWLALGILTLINLFNYLDRSIAPAIMPAIQKDLSLSDTQVGLLGTCFILVYFVISPLFGWLGDRANRNRLMAAGVGVWSLATGLAGFVANFSQLVFARSAVGVGEAAYGSISPALIGDLFPKEKRGRVFAFFFMAMPVGVALGYLLGGILEAKYGWRHAFFFAGFPGIILAIALWWLPEPKRGAFDTEATAALLPVKQVYAALARNRAYVFTVLGYAAYTFVVGAVMVWVPTYLVRFLSVSLEKGNTVFGGITVVTGFLATFIGGIWGDRWAKKNADAYLLLSALSMFLAAPAFALLLMQTDFVCFSIVLFVVEFLVFLSTSPINAQIVNCVNPAYRATANAVSIFAIHLLGDALSPTLIGIVSDQSNLRSALMLCPFVFLLAGLLWSMKSAFEFSVLPWPQQWRLPLLQAHRGYRPEGIQENTVKAFRLAKANGAQMIELDVRLARDGKVVVAHDADLKRVAGVGSRVAELSSEDLAQYDLPTLEQVLMDRHIPALVNIEVKSEGVGSGKLERAIAQTVRACNAQERVLFSSFNPIALGRLARHLPAVPRALLVTLADEPLNRWYLRKMVLAFLARPHMLNLDEEMYTEDLARRLKERRIPVAVWTVNDEARARNCLALGAESIISDKPRLIT